MLCATLHAVAAPPRGGLTQALGSMETLSMVRIRRLHEFRNRPDFADYITFINNVRANYEWAEKSYSPENSQHVYLISSHTKAYGYVDAELKDADLSSSKKPYIFLNDLHIAPDCQRAGIGQEVLRHFLGKELDIEFVIANCNAKIQRFIEKFNHSKKYVTEHTSTIRIAADSSGVTGAA